MERLSLVPYDPEDLMSFLDTLGTFAPRRESVVLPGGIAGQRLGYLHLDEEVPVVALEVNQAAKKRRKDWEGPARYLLERGLSAGLFVFHDAYGAYRLSLIHARYRGRGQPQFSDYRRYSLIAHLQGPNKTFFQQLRRRDRLRSSPQTA